MSVSHTNALDAERDVYPADQPPQVRPRHPPAQGGQGVLDPFDRPPLRRTSPPEGSPSSEILRVPPRITGPWQVSARSHASSMRGSRWTFTTCTIGPHAANKRRPR